VTNSNWWERFFEGLAVDLWLDAIPGEVSRREAENIVALLDVSEGAELLDVPCGAGRLSLPLAERGYRMTGVDLSGEFLGHARAAAGADRVVWEQRDMRDLAWRNRFDGAFCAGNSFGYLADDGNAEFLRAVAAALKPGARFVLDTPMVLENMLAHIAPRGWWTVGDMHLLADNRYDAATGRLEIDYTFVRDGHTDTRHGSHRAYSYRQLVELLDASGFSVETAEPWTKEARTIQFIATKH